MKIVLTGKMSITRVEETRRFQAYGITVQKAVTNATDYLITGSLPGDNKLNAARHKGTKIMTELEFFDMLIEDYPEVLL